jgi:hypothetical protein
VRAARGDNSDRYAPGASRQKVAATILETAEDLDGAVVRRRALEEIGEVANRWADRLPEDCPEKEQFERLRQLAPPQPHPQAV